MKHLPLIASLLPFACGLAAQERSTAQDPPKAESPKAEANQKPAEPSAQEPKPAQPIEVAPEATGSLRVCIDVAAGAGTLKQTTQNNSGRDGDTEAYYVRFGVELIGSSGFGGGIRAEGVQSDDELLLDTLGIRSTATDSELFFHGTGIFGDDDASTAVRLGIFTRTYDQKDKVTDQRLEWSSFGLRLEVEPELTILRKDGLRWSGFGRGSVAMGLTTASSHPATFDADTSMLGLDIGIGTRVQIYGFEFGMGYNYRMLSLEQSETINSQAFAAVDMTYSGLWASFAFRF